MNKTLLRILRKNMDLSSREELEALLRDLPQSPDFRERAGTVHGLVLDTIDAVDKALSDLDRMVDLRDRSLSISSKELVTLNDAVSEQSRKLQAVLDHLQSTIRLLRQDQQVVVAEGENDLGELVKVVEELVKSQLNAARNLKILFEEGLEISSAMSLKSLDKQVQASVSRVAGTPLRASIYFAAQLFGGPESPQYFRCAEDGSRGSLFDIQHKTSETYYLNITSPKTRAILAIVALTLTGTESDVTRLMGHLQPLLPNVAATIENIRLMQEEKHKQHMENELQTARFVQRALLPVEKARTLDGGLEINGYYQSATECGGDWWTEFRLDDGRHIILVGDVTGHGTGSAIVCAVVKGYSESFRSRQGLTIEAILTELNAVVYGISEAAGRAMTMTAIGVDLKAGTITFCNAGHPHPVMIKPATEKSSARSLEFLFGSGAILGTAPSASFVERVRPFRSGDQILLYSDGLTERVSRDHSQYGESRLCRLLTNSKPGLTAAELNRLIVQDVQDFALGFEPTDDITSVVIRNISA